MIFIHELLDPVRIIEAIGLLGVFLIIFAESGFFFGFFLPGDSLLFTAGFLASQNFFSPYSFSVFTIAPVVLLFLGAFIAAVAGDSVGFAFGRRVGPSIFSKEDSLFFNKKYPIEAQKFYDRHGKKTVILARFVPIVRTFAPIIAGVGSMNYRVFFSYNVIGGLIWTAALIFLGFFLGKTIPHAENYVTPFVVLIILISFAPAILHFAKEYWAKKAE
jgi:membrane-associated protein